MEDWGEWWRQLALWWKHFISLTTKLRCLFFPYISHQYSVRLFRCVNTFETLIHLIIIHIIIIIIILIIIIIVNIIIIFMKIIKMPNFFTFFSLHALFICNYYCFFNQLLTLPLNLRCYSTINYFWNCMMLEHTKRQFKVLFLSKNAFIFRYVYHCSLLFGSFSNISQKNKKLLVIQESMLFFSLSPFLIWQLSVQLKTLQIFTFTRDCFFLLVWYRWPLGWFSRNSVCLPWCTAKE